MSPAALSAAAPSFRSARSKRGFLAIDALVGLSIMTLGLVFVIVVSGQALRLLGQANDLRAASAQAAMCLEARNTPSPQPQTQAAELDGAALTAQSREVEEPSNSGKRLCLVECIVRSPRSHAVVRLHTQRLCQGVS